MSLALLLEQSLNGLQLGVMLFLMAAGLTLVFGIMQVINLAHGSLFMVGAYVCASTYAFTHNIWQAAAAALIAAMALGVVLELAVFRTLYERDHLDQVLATFGLIMIFNELARTIWGAAAIGAAVPDIARGHVQVMPGVEYPVYRLLILAVGLITALVLYGTISWTRLGMLIRAGASNRWMVTAMGVNVRMLYTIVFAAGATLSALAGLMAAPLLTVEPGMGEGPLISAFVVIVIGGIGSIRGALVAAIFVGLVDTLGRIGLNPLLSKLMSVQAAQTVGPAISSMLIYVLMAVVLFFKPLGLFPPRGRQ